MSLLSTRGLYIGQSSPPPVGGVYQPLTFGGKKYKKRNRKRGKCKRKKKKEEEKEKWELKGF